jgi:hypothetical protein
MELTFTSIKASSISRSNIQQIRMDLFQVTTLVAFFTSQICKRLKLLFSIIINRAAITHEVIEIKSGETLLYKLIIWRMEDTVFCIRNRELFSHYLFILGTILPIARIKSHQIACLRKFSINNRVFTCKIRLVEIVNMGHV